MNSNLMTMKFCNVFLFVIGMISYAMNGEEVRVVTHEKELFLELSDHHTLGQIKQSIAQHQSKQGEFILAFKGAKESSYDSSGRGRELGYPRDYYREVTVEEKADIHFIITTLATKSLVSLAKASVRNDLERAGDRIEHIHPMRFLCTIFCDETLKVGIRNMRSRGWIWGSFVDGLKNSLNTETKINNVTMEYVENFAKSVQIDPQLIIAFIEQKKWDSFIDTTIRSVPRFQNSDRYD